MTSSPRSSHMMSQLPLNLLLWKITDGTHLTAHDNDFHALFSTKILEIQILDINSTLIDKTRPHGQGERRSDVSMVQGMVVRDPETWHQVSSFFVTVYRDYVLPFHGRNEYDDGVEGSKKPTVVILGTIKLTSKSAARGGIDLMDDITMKESRNMPTPADHAVAVGNQAKGDRNKVGKASSNVS
ncbi:hypothetical protein SCP_1104320 [Sparassis crispa]|uniref:Uncharacterized protein n=1 Tax=Sparassis crispa TaxID=139825 RepID=A0A401H003_9APHY|nr:hypothetical protein SCP_1104320 [Sparassis crispa]GBE87755.1 hypothetical protein SCP_1104320 [Sparassis crispa]